MTTISIIAAIAYGTLAFIGGILAYTKVHSKPSLVSGTISGVLLITSGLIQLQGLSWGATLSLALTGLLVVVFSLRLAKTRKFIPAGLMLLAGLVTFSVILSSWFKMA
jgi:uncharacterized membrane protein (UPF0136 family)